MGRRDTEFFPQLIETNNTSLWPQEMDRVIPGVVNCRCSVVYAGYNPYEVFHNSWHDSPFPDQTQLPALTSPLPVNHPLPSPPRNDMSSISAPRSIASTPRNHVANAITSHAQTGIPPGPQVAKPSPCSFHLTNFTSSSFAPNKSTKSIGGSLVHTGQARVW